VRAIVDRVGVEGGDHRSDIAEARTLWQAHDIDGITVVNTGGTAVSPGSFLDVRVTSVEDDYDLTATLDRVIDRPASRLPRPSGRALPLASIGSYGR
jgi:hypothetical protein